MGIKSFLSILERYAPNAITPRRFDEFDGKKIAVDTSIFLTKFLSSGSLSQCYPFASHLYGMFYLARFLRGGNIYGPNREPTDSKKRKNPVFETFPLFVFDGAQRCEAKRLFELERRARARQKHEVQLELEQERVSLLEQMVQWLEEFDKLPTRTRQALGSRIGSYIADQSSKSHVRLSVQKADELESKFSELFEGHNILSKLATGQRTSNIENQVTLLCQFAVIENLAELKQMLNDSLSKSIKQIALMQGRSARISTVVAAETQRLLKLLGIPYTVAPPQIEAEAYCAALTAAGVTDATLTEDTDASFFGDGLVLHKLVYGSSGRPTVLQIDPKVAQQTLALTRTGYIDLAILMGCDFSNTIKGIGPHTALKLIKEHHSIENIISSNPQLSSSEFEKNYQQARDIFMNKVSIQKHDWSPLWTSIKEDGLHQLLSSKKLPRLIASYQKDKLLKRTDKVADSNLPNIDTIYEEFLQQGLAKLSSQS